MPVAVAEVEAWLDRLFVAAEGATLRREERRKAVEVAALLAEIERALPARRAATLVDAAAGKAYVGLLAARLVLAPRAGGRVIAVEREEPRAGAARAAAAALELDARVVLEVRTGDVGDASVWPEEPDLVVALHACGGAADAILAQAVRARARRLLLVPCCTQASDAALRQAGALGIPRQAAVRRAFIESIVAAERTLRLEAAGWQTEAVAFVPPTVTPYNTLLRARRVGEAGRMRDAAARLARLVTPPV